mmetsp:Transcript_20209/g.46566  ORF Transcript_20209/g.46566 Transcript_20209/m.46566 type:complete len:134 (-) Transcript_20209:603-1004(-)
MVGLAGCKNGLLWGLFLLACGLFVRDVSGIESGAAPPASKVIGAGLCKTGTESVRKALDTLGYKTYHHMLTRDAGHHGLWEKVYKTRGMCRESVQAALDAMDGDGYNASIDLPVNLLYREQLARHPDAKVILR